MNSHFDPHAINGLSSQEARFRLLKNGPNELPAEKKHSLWEIAFTVVCEPMFLMLIGGGLIYLMLGDEEEALLLMGFVFLVMGITLNEERKAERALEALRDLSSPRAVVIRDGQNQRIAGREVVCGDIVFIAEGDRVPADACLLDAMNLLVDESLLTGESVPVSKRVAKITRKMQQPGGDDTPFLYSGTLVVQGQGFAEVLSTGEKTEIGKIGRSLQVLQQEDTLLHKEVRRLVFCLSIAGLSLCTVMVAVFGFVRGEWLQGILAGITLAMATLPEEFPVVLTVFLALGAWRMSKKKVLTRRVAAIETLGAATVLCVDKTGTLTENRMAVKTIFTNNQFYDIGLDNEELPETLHEIVEFSILASQRDPFEPMEKAFKQLGERYLQQTEHLHADWTLEQEYPLQQDLLAISHVWKSPHCECYMIASKGAPEAIMDLCHFSDLQRQNLLLKIEKMANAGMRVLGVAKAEFSSPVLPGKQHDFVFDFLGLVGLSDPVRSSVPDAIQECYGAGIRVVMITGDYAGTAQSIGRDIGLMAGGGTMTGSELAAMDDARLQEAIHGISIFARVVPEQKLRIVNALKTTGEIVAMTGDGVNDAPALKSAHIGIAMGGRGTDVAREAAALVLLNDDFSSIVQSIAMGRRIFDNIKKSMIYILAIHVPIVGISLIPLFLDWPLVLFPAHVVLLEMIIDPACALVFEAEEAEEDSMIRPPRKATATLINKEMVMISLGQGISVFAVIFAVFSISLYLQRGENEARALAFVTLIVGNLGLIFANRSWSQTILGGLRSHNTVLWWVTGGAVLFVGLVLYVPFLRNLFKFAELHMIDLIICFVAGGISVAWFEILKLVRLRRKKNC
ncbi:MAG: cation-translocating P-type ATPase [Negativicutes bacterium]